MPLPFIFQWRYSKGKFLAYILLLAAVPLAAQERYHRTNLVSDIAGVALRTDPNLINAWGIAFSSAGPIWIADNGRALRLFTRPMGKRSLSDPPW